MADIDERLASLEKRVEELEHELGKQGAAPPSPEPVKPSPSRPPLPPVPTKPKGPPASDLPAKRAPSSLAPQVLGISGVAALVLAASYLVRLAIDSDWLTPVRQLAIAATAGIACVAGGLWLRGSGRRYASLLSAAGIVVLFLTVYAAHLHFGFIEAGLATAWVVALCFLALCLGGVFRTPHYAFIAVVGAYSTPFLLGAPDAEVLQLVLYYSAWSALFCGYSIWVGGRHAYVVASLLAIIGFDGLWRLSGSNDWQTAAIYQALQFLLFTATTAFYSAKHRSPLTRTEAGVHAPSLFLFYTIEYAILNAHIPRWAPWIALSSVAVLLGAYAAARPRLAGATAGGTLVSWYAALVLFQAGYLELVPGELQPWLALGIFVGLGIVCSRTGLPKTMYRPLVGAGAVICVLNYLRLLSDLDTDQIPLVAVLYVAYAVVLYAGYVLIRGRAPGLARHTLLYLGHISALVAVQRLVDTSVVVSVLWGAIAIGSLLIAARKHDRVLAQSSFLVFAASGLKVMFFDLADSAPLVRIGCLAVLGVSLYAGGWLYQRIEDIEVQGER